MKEVLRKNIIILIFKKRITMEDRSIEQDIK